MLFLYNFFNKFITFFNSNNIQTINVKDNINPTINTDIHKVKIIFNKYLNYNLFYHWKNTYKNKNKKLLDYVTFIKY